MYVMFEYVIACRTHFEDDGMRERTLTMPINILPDRSYNDSIKFIKMFIGKISSIDMGLKIILVGYGNVWYPLVWLYKRKREVNLLDHLTIMKMFYKFNLIINFQILENTLYRKKIVPFRVILKEHCFTSEEMLMDREWSLSDPSSFGKIEVAGPLLATEVIYETFISRKQ